MPGMLGIDGDGIEPGAFTARAKQNERIAA